jgi:hypothetical protein
MRDPNKGPSGTSKIPNRVILPNRVEANLKSRQAGRQAGGGDEPEKKMRRGRGTSK